MRHQLPTQSGYVEAQASDPKGYVEAQATDPKGYVEAQATDPKGYVQAPATIRFIRLTTVQMPSCQPCLAISQR